MTQDQVLGQLRQLMPAIGWILIATGKVNPAEWASFIDVMIPAAGAAFVLGSAAWALLANSKASIIKSVAQMPETQVVKNGIGLTTVVIHDKELADAANVAATPLVNGKDAK